KFNHFFNSVPDTVRASADFIQWVPPVDHLNSITSIYLSPTCAYEVQKLVSGFKNKGPGHDGVSTLLLKSILTSILDPLVYLINLSMDKGIYPDILKISQIVPIFKSGDCLQCCNYGPISILSAFNKVYEKLLYSRIVKFLEKFNLLSNCQFGFRAAKSTEHALLDVVSEIREALNNGEYCAGFFLDLSRAFDIIDHDILLEKFRWFGIRGVAHDLLKSYLSSRKHQTKIGTSGVLSGFLRSKIGIPQGSVLGPLFFLLMIQDIIHSCDAKF